MSNEQNQSKAAERAVDEFRSRLKQALEAEWYNEFRRFTLEDVLTLIDKASRVRTPKKYKRTDTIGNGIKHLRKKTGLSQSAFAERVNIKRSTLGSYEEGRAEPDLGVLYRMTAIAEVSMDNFFKLVYSPINIE